MLGLPVESMLGDLREQNGELIVVANGLGPVRGELQELKCEEQALVDQLGSMGRKLHELVGEHQVMSHGLGPSSGSLRDLLADQEQMLNRF